jgi:hypothetical protein
MKRFLLSSLTAGFCNIALSQTFTPEFGLNYLIQPTSFYDVKSGGIIYSPRLNVHENKNSSLSIGFPMTLAWSSLNYVQVSAIDIPIELNYNVGAGSLKGNKKSFGYFFGGGFGFHLNNVNRVIAYNPTLFFVYPISGRFGIPLRYFDPVCEFGPTLNAGVRVAVGHSGKTITFRLSFMRVVDVPAFLRSYVSVTNEFSFQNTIILGFGCLFSF